MNKHQSKWDACLIRGWIAEAKMINVVQWFLEQVQEDLLEYSEKYKMKIMKDVPEVSVWLTKSGLNRCTDKTRGGVLHFHSLKVPVRAFVNIRSKQLSNALWNGADPFKVLKNISNFRWVKYTQPARNATKKQRDRMAYLSTRVIKARELDKNHHWDIVK